MSPARCVPRRHVTPGFGNQRRAWARSVVGGGGPLQRWTERRQWGNQIAWGRWPPVPSRGDLPRCLRSEAGRHPAGLLGEPLQCVSCPDTSPADRWPLPRAAKSPPAAQLGSLLLGSVGPAGSTADGDFRTGLPGGAGDPTRLRMKRPLPHTTCVWVLVTLSPSRTARQLPADGGPPGHLVPCVPWSQPCFPGAAKPVPQRGTQSISTGPPTAHPHHPGPPQPRAPNGAPSGH